MTEFSATLSRRTMLSTAATLALVGATAGVAPERALAQSAIEAELMKPGALPDMVLGKADAPVTIVEYASMTCPHCANWHKTVLPHIKEKYIEPGKVKLIFREFPLDPLAAAASMLARCAPQDKYFDMTSMFFDQQRTWAHVDDPVSALFNLVKQVGFTQDSFKACLTNQTLLDGVKESRARADEKFGVDATPTFFVNGKKQKGFSTPDEVDQVLGPLVKS